MENQTVRTERPVIEGVILCGGKGARLGHQNKGLILFNGKPLVCQQIKKIKPFCQKILINNNDHFAEYGNYQLRSTQDLIEGHVGPLAGIHSALSFIQPKTTHLLVLAVDYPYLPNNVFEQLLSVSAQYKNNIIAVYDKNRSHPLIAIFPRDLKHDIADYLDKGNRRVIPFLRDHQARYIDCSDLDEQLFTNINNPEQLHNNTIPL
jgi:molybdopterin-guanine dinucleotide biosynthesis protein A